MMKYFINLIANIKLRLNWRTTQKKLIADIRMLQALAKEADRHAQELEKVLEQPGGLLFGKTKVLKAFRFHKHNAEGIRKQIVSKEGQLREQGAKFKFALSV
jgi:hypothetical protein